MSYPGNKINEITLLSSNTVAYNLSAAATETAFTQSIGVVDLAVNDGIIIKAKGTSAGNANAKGIELLVNGAATILTITNNTTTAPNGLPWTIELHLFKRSATVMVYDAIINFNGVAPEIQVGTSTLSLSSGTPNIVLDLTGLAANDLVAHSLQIYKYTV
jgi:hypothetical protein